MRKYSLIPVMLIECFLVSTLHPEWAAFQNNTGRASLRILVMKRAWAGERFPSAVGKSCSLRPGLSLLRPKPALRGELEEAMAGTSKDGGERNSTLSDPFSLSFANLGQGRPEEILSETLEILDGDLSVGPRGILIPREGSESPYAQFSEILNRNERPYWRTRELFASLARHHHFKFARGMKSLIQREKDGRVLIHASLTDPRYAPPKEIFWEFWVVLLRSSAIRHDPELIGNQVGFTAHLFGLLGEVGRLLLMSQEKREKLTDYLVLLSQSPDFSVDTEFLKRYMKAVDEVEERLEKNFVDLSRGTRHIYTNFGLRQALPPLVRLLNPKGWPEEAFTGEFLPRDVRVRLSTELKRLRRAEEYQRVMRTINGEGDRRVPEIAVIGDVKMDARALRLLLNRAVERDVDKIIMEGDIFGKSRGRSQGGSPLAMYDALRKFEETFKGRIIYLFGADDLMFLFTMMGYPRLEQRWFSGFGGREFLEARNVEIRNYNEEKKRQEGPEAGLLPEVTLSNFREDPRLREVAEWMKNRFYIYHLDEFGVLHMNGGLPGALEGRESVSFAAWDRVEGFIRTHGSFKARAFSDVMDPHRSPVMFGDWEKVSRQLALAEFLPTVKVDGEGGHEVIAIMTGAPNFNHDNRSFGNDFDDPSAEGGAGVALRFVGRQGIELERYREETWVSQQEESPESFLGKVRENAKKRIEIVARDLPRQDEIIFSLLRQPVLSEESRDLHFVRTVKAALETGARLSEKGKERLRNIAEKVLYHPEEVPDREELSRALGIEPFFGNILYNKETQEAIFLVGEENIGRSYISWLLVGEKKEGSEERFYPGWILISHEATQLFVIGDTLFGGTQPLRNIPEEWRELFYKDREGRIKKTGILPTEKIVEISRIIFLTDERIVREARTTVERWLRAVKGSTHEDRIQSILAIQRAAHQVPSEALEAALRKVSIEKFHVGTSREIRGVRLPRIARAIDAEVGHRALMSRGAVWASVHLPRGRELLETFREFRHGQEFPQTASKRDLKGGEDRQKNSSDGGAKKVETVVTVSNQLGIHARPSAEIVSAATQFAKTEIRLTNLTLKPGEEADAKNILAVMMLAAEKGHDIRITAEGEDAEKAVAAVADKIRNLSDYSFSKDGGEKIIEETVGVGDPADFIRRVAPAIVGIAMTFPTTEIWLTKTGDETPRADAKSITTLWFLNVVENDTLRITARGEDAEKAVSAIREVILSGAQDGGGRRNEMREVSKTFIQSLSGVRHPFGEGGAITEEERIFTSLYGYHYLMQRIERLGKKKLRLVIGRDPRPTGEMVRDAQIVGFLAAAKEANVELEIVDLGVLPIPILESAVRTLEADGGVMITASHNPIEWNGWKYLTGFHEPEGDLVQGGAILSLRDMEEDLRDKRMVSSVQAVDAGDEALPRAFREITPARVQSRLRDRSDEIRKVEEGYLEFVKGVFLIDDSHLEALRERAGRIKVILDTNGGAAAGIYKRSLEYFGFQVVEIERSLGQPAHRIEPVDEALQETKTLVEMEKAHFGSVTDWDADRSNSVILSAEGKAVENDPQQVSALNVAMILSLYDLAGKFEGGKKIAIVAHDPTSRRAHEVARQFGAEVVEAEVGEVNVVTQMEILRNQGYVVPIGIEGYSGGTIFGESKSRDGFLSILATALLATDPRIGENWLKKAGNPAAGRDHFTLEDLVAALPVYYSKRGEIEEQHLDQRALKEHIETLFQGLLTKKGESFVITGLPGRKYQRYNILHYEGTEVGPVLKEGTGGFKIRLFNTDGNVSYMWLRGSKTGSGFRLMADSKDEKEAEALLALVKTLFSQAKQDLQAQDGAKKSPFGHELSKGEEESMMAMIRSFKERKYTLKKKSHREHSTKKIILELLRKDYYFRFYEMDEADFFMFPRKEGTPFIVKAEGEEITLLQELPAGTSSLDYDFLESLLGERMARLYRASQPYQRAAALQGWLQDRKANKREAIRLLSIAVAKDYHGAYQFYKDRITEGLNSTAAYALATTSDREKAYQFYRKLIDGIDPITGESIPKVDPTAAYHLARTSDREANYTAYQELMAVRKAKREAPLKLRQFLTERLSDHPGLRNKLQRVLSKGNTLVDYNATSFKWLVVLALSGDEEAISKLKTLYRPFIYAQASSLYPNAPLERKMEYGEKGLEDALLGLRHLEAPRAYITKMIRISIMVGVIKEIGFHASLEEGKKYLDIGDDDETASDGGGKRFEPGPARVSPVEQMAEQSI